MFTWHFGVIYSEDNPDLLINIKCNLWRVLPLFTTVLNRRVAADWTGNTRGRPEVEDRGGRHVNTSQSRDLLVRLPSSRAH